MTNTVQVTNAECDLYNSLTIDACLALGVFVPGSAVTLPTGCGEMGTAIQSTNKLMVDLDDDLVGIRFIDGFPDQQDIRLATWSVGGIPTYLEFSSSRELLGWVEFNMPDCYNSLRDFLSIPLHEREDDLPNIIGLRSEASGVTTFAVAAATHPLSLAD